MLRIAITLASIVILLSGCVTFYQNPGSADPAAIFIEKGERTVLDRYRYFTLAEIDGLPVSHMGVMSADGNVIRVQPGKRRMLFKVGYLNGLSNGQHRAVFALELNVEAGKRYQIGGSVSDDNHVVFTITELSNPVSPWVRLTAVGQFVQPNMTLGVPGGGFVIIPSRQ